MLSVRGPITPLKGDQLAFGATRTARGTNATGPLRHDERHMVGAADVLVGAMPASVMQCPDAPWLSAMIFAVPVIPHRRLQRDIRYV